MKYAKIITAALAIAMMAGTAFAQQQQQQSNRYAMKLTDNGDGTYSLQQQKKYEKAGFDVNSLPGVLTPYTHQNERIKTKDYRGVRTEDIIFKKGPDYELKLSIDFSADPNPSPVMFYIHGGGWARGNNGSGKQLSQYLAMQHGITGVRVEYAMAGQTDVTVETSVQDVLDALAYVQEHAAELNIDPSRYGFLGTSAGGHLAAVAAMKTQPKVLVGYSGIYDVTEAAIVQRTKDPVRIAYFGNRDDKVLRDNSALYLIPKKGAPATMLVAGTYDVTVESDQTTEFGKALRKRGAEVRMDVYPKYDHNLTSRSSDKYEEIFFNTVDFVTKNIGATYTPAPAEKAAKKEKEKGETVKVVKPLGKKTKVPAGTTQSSIVTTSTQSGQPELTARGIFCECPDSSGVHAQNHMSHIVKTFDEDLEKDVYSFLIHVDIDDDRGLKDHFTDRQRNEIKTAHGSPKEYLAYPGETVTYKWKMRLPEGFKTTNRFTHLHQLKGIDNKTKTALVGRPLLTLLAKSTGSKGKQELCVRYYDRRKGDNEPETLDKVDLSLLTGRWVQFEETVTYGAGDDGKYSITMTDAITGEPIFEYKNDSLDMWRTDAPELRPKWGIYRYLGKEHEYAGQLRDEEVRFADFEIIKHQN